MKIGVSMNPIVSTMGPEKGFRFLRDAGFDCVDFNFCEPLPYAAVVGGRTASLYDKPLAEVQAYYQPYIDGMKEAGITAQQAHAPFPSYTPNDAMNETIIMAVQKCIAVCNDMDCRYLIVHPYFAAYAQRFDRETQWALNKAFYERLIPYAKEYQVGICLENMFTDHRRRIYAATCSDMEEAVTYVDRLNDIAGYECFSFCYDTGHQTVLGQDMRESLRRLGKRVTTLHIHDNDGRDDLHMAPYMGVSDWEAFITGLKDIGYQGAISFETGSVARLYPEELWPQVMALQAATGRYFAKRIKER